MLAKYFHKGKTLNIFPLYSILLQLSDQVIDKQVGVVMCQAKVNDKEAVGLFNTQADIQTNIFITMGCVIIMRRLTYTYK